MADKIRFNYILLVYGIRGWSLGSVAFLWKFEKYLHKNADARMLDCRGLNAIRCVAKCYFLHFNGNCRLDSGLE